MSRWWVQRISLPRAFRPGGRHRLVIGDLLTQVGTPRPSENPPFPWCSQAPLRRGLATWGCVSSASSHLPWSSGASRGTWLDARPEPHAGVLFQSSLTSPITGDITPLGLREAREGVTSRGHVAVSSPRSDHSRRSSLFSRDVWPLPRGAGFPRGSKRTCFSQAGVNGAETASYVSAWLRSQAEEAQSKPPAGAAAGFPGGAVSAGEPSSSVYKERRGRSEEAHSEGMQVFRFAFPPARPQTWPPVSGELWGTERQ